MDVTSGSAAEQAGFASRRSHPGNQPQPVKNARDYQAVIDKAKKGDPWNFWLSGPSKATWSLN
jgi:hypothetical protein